MRGNLVVGMIAGGMIGAIAAMIAAPYVQPQIRRVVSRGKQAISTHMDKMDTES
jgi:gas vesicle protein